MHPRARGSRCRRCGRVSTRVHSRYRRQLADLPVAGRPVEVWLAVRRFFCDHVDCSAGTFVEQVPGLILEWCVMGCSRTSSGPLWSRYCRPPTVVRDTRGPVSYTHLRAHETDSYLVCRLLLEKKKQKQI